MIKYLKPPTAMPVESKWNRESQLALQAVSSVSEILAPQTDRLSFSVKGSLRDIFTQIDTAAEQHISAILKESEYPIIAEESQEGKKMTSLPAPPFWLVDPIDGTVNFVHGLPLYSVSVGLFHEDFVIGAVSLPAFKELFFTHNDCAYLNGRPLRVSDTDLRRALVVACFSGFTGSNFGRRNQFEFFGQINDLSRGCLRLGSAALSLCYAASGRVQAVFGIDNEIWDVAAGIAIAKLAGCKALVARTPRSTRLSYLVGAPTVVDEIREFLDQRGVIQFETH